MNGYSLPVQMRSVKKNSVVNKFTTTRQTRPAPFTLVQMLPTVRRQPVLKDTSFCNQYPLPGLRRKFPNRHATNSSTDHVQVHNPPNLHCPSAREYQKTLYCCCHKKRPGVLSSHRRNTSDAGAPTSDFNQHPKPHGFDFPSPMSNKPE